MKIRLIPLLLTLLFTPALADGKKVLFIGNSFTYGATGSAQFYHPENVHDLNNEGIGGVPSIFKTFANQANMDFDISLETIPGSGLDTHFDKKLKVLDKKWDIVIMQSFSTLDAKNPNNPAKLIEYSQKLTKIFQAKNKKVDLYLTATWSRADQTYKSSGFWYGKPIEQMGNDVFAGYKAALDANNGAIKNVIPVGLAWNHAFELGIADKNPYDGVDFGKINLWGWDQYHASNYGYYLHALVDFGVITGYDVTQFGKKERAAYELGISGDDAIALQKVAQDTILANKSQ